MCVHMSEFSRPCTLHRWEAYLVSFYLMIWYPSLVMYRTKNTEVYSESFSDSFKFSTFSFCVFQTHLKIDFLSIYTQSKDKTKTGFWMLMGQVSVLSALRQSTHPGVWVTESDDTKWRTNLVHVCYNRRMAIFSSITFFFGRIVQA